MNDLFFDMLDSGMAVFLDNILMYLCMVDEHFMTLEKNTGVLMAVYILL